MTETIIAGAELYDGSGAAGYRADVTVRDGVIAAVVPASDTPPEQAIDARGLALYAARLLRGAEPGGPPRTLWIFPQGALLPARVPLAFRSGLARFSRAVPDALLLPVAVRYEVRADQRPECFVRIGAPVHSVPGEAPARLTRRLEQRLRDELDRLDADLTAAHPAGYRVALAGQRSVNLRYDRWLARLRGQPVE